MGSGHHTGSKAYLGWIRGRDYFEPDCCKCCGSAEGVQDDGICIDCHEEADAAEFAASDE